MPELIVLGVFVVLAAAVMFFLFLNKPVTIIYIQIGYACSVRFFISQFHLPEAIKYLSDVFVLLSFVQLLFNRKKILRLNCNLRKPLVAILLFLLVSAIGFIGNAIGAEVSIMFFLWGLRIYMRFFIIFIACVVFLGPRDIDNLLRLLLALLPVNAIISSAQYFIQGYRFDFVGGLFGTYVGCNANMNLYLVIVSATLALWGVSGKISMLVSMLGLALALYTAALSELKVLFFEIPFILALIVALTFPNRKAIAMTVIGVGAVVLSVALFILLYPSWGNFFNLDTIRNYTVDANYGGGVALNRLRVIPFVFGEILQTTPGRLFGMGLGNTERFLNFASPFYSKYSEYHYAYFTHAILLLEIGIIGFCVYVWFLISILADSFRLSSKTDPMFKSYNHATIITVLLCFLLITYSAAMRNDAAYILFFVFAIPYIMENFERSQGESGSLPAGE